MYLNFTFVTSVIKSLPCHATGEPRAKTGLPASEDGSFFGRCFFEDIEVVQTDQVALRVYCVAKTVADCFKHRNKIGLDVAIEALKDALSQKKATANDLWRYARICRVANVMRPYLETLGQGI